MKHLVTFLFLYLSLFYTVLFAENGWHFSSVSGVPISFDNKLVLYADNTTYTIDASYKSKAYSDFPYWTLRTEYWLKNHAIGLEVVHHKVYLSNPTDFLESFSVSDGFNLIYLNYANKINKNNIIRTGFGLNFGNPDVKIDGRDRYLKRHLEGLHFGGFTSQLSYEKRFYETQKMFLFFETKLTQTFATLPISNNSDEYALVPDTAIHVSIGFGTKPTLLKGNWKEKASFFSPFLLPNTLYILREGTIQ